MAGVKHARITYVCEETGRKAAVPIQYAWVGVTELYSDWEERYIRIDKCPRCGKTHKISI